LDDADVLRNGLHLEVDVRERVELRAVELELAVVDAREALDGPRAGLERIDRDLLADLEAESDPRLVAVQGEVGLPDVVDSAVRVGHGRRRAERELLADREAVGQEAARAVRAAEVERLHR